MPKTNIVAHSHGAMTAPVALAEQGVPVDRFLASGSANFPKTCGRRPTSPRTTSTQHAPTGKQGVGDERAEFGREQGHAPRSVDRGTESLRNVGLATTGRDAELTPATPG